MSNQLITRLRALDACAVSDALDALGLLGAVPGLRALSTNQRIVGAAITVQLGPVDGGVSKRHLCTAAVEAGGAGDIIVISHGREDVAGWGGILSLGAKLKGIEGVVIDGACRDLDESREFELPIYAKASTPRTARGRIVEKAWNVPVSVEGIAVAPGDLVIADASGVVFVPQARAQEVLTRAERIAAREKLMQQDLRRGHSIADVMGADYESMLDEGQKP